MIKLELSSDKYHKLYNYLKKESTEGQYFIWDVKWYGNSNVVIKEKTSTKFILYKDFPLIWNYVDFSLIYHFCEIKFQDDQSSILVNIKIKLYQLVWIFVFLYITIMPALANRKDLYLCLPFDFIVLIVILILFKRKFKKFILNYIKMITNEN